MEVQPINWNELDVAHGDDHQSLVFTLHQIQTCSGPAPAPSLETFLSW